MQSSKKQLAVTISFSKRNMDIYDFLQEQKQKILFNQNDYICNAIRFYEQYKNDEEQLNADYIKKLIDEKLIIFKDTLLNEISIDANEDKKEIDIEDIQDIEESNYEDD